MLGCTATVKDCPFYSSKRKCFQNALSISYTWIVLQCNQLSCSHSPKEATSWELKRNHPSPWWERQGENELILALWILMCFLCRPFLSICSCTHRSFLRCWRGILNAEFQASSHSLPIFYLTPNSDLNKGSLHCCKPSLLWSPTTRWHKQQKLIFL